MIAKMQDTELLFLDIEVPKEKLLTFCRKAVKMELFLGLVLQEEENKLSLFVNNDINVLSFSLKEDLICIDDSFFNSDFDNRLFLVFEGLASVFNGTYVVKYKDDSISGCKVSIVDGVSTHCGERCLVRNVVFPSV